MVYGKDCGTIMRLKVHNKYGEALELEIDGLENSGSGRLVFIQHGLSGHKGQVMVRRPAEAFLKHGYVTVTFDSRYSFGNSDGPLEKATLSSFFEDLQTIVDWARQQDFYAEPFALSGHSLGGGSILHYAENFPEKVSLLVPVAAMVGGKYFIRSRLLNEGEIYRQWRRDGRLYRENKNNPTINGWLSFNVVHDMLRYDLVRNAGSIKCPVLLITGDADLSSTVYNNTKLLNALSCPKELVILKECAHLFERAANGQDLYDTIDKWIECHV